MFWLLMIVKLFVVFCLTGTVVGGVLAIRMRPSISGWAAGWITGLFITAGVSILPAFINITSHWPGHFSDWVGFMLGIFLARRGVLSLKKAYSQIIPIDPPTIGAVTIWNKYSKHIKEAGKNFLPNFWPFYVNVVQITLARYNLDAKFVDFSTVKPGVTVSGSWSIVYSLDRDNIIQFLKNERQKGIDNQLKDVIPKSLKDIFGKITWENAIQGIDEAYKGVSNVLTGNIAIPSQVELNAGVSDKLGFGILVHSFYLSEVTSSMAKQAQTAEAQKIAREGQKQEIEGVKEQIKILVETGMTAKDAADMVNIRSEEGVTKHILDIQGLQQSQGGAITADAIIGLLQALDVEVSEEQKEKVRTMFPIAQTSTGGVGGNMFGLAAFLSTLGIQLPKQGQSEINQKPQNKNGQGEGPKAAVFNKEEAEEIMKQSFRERQQNQKK